MYVVQHGCYVFTIDLICHRDVLRRSDAQKQHVGLLLMP